MVQHGEGEHGAEPGRVKRKCGRIGVHNLDACLGHSGAKRCRQFLVDLHRGQTGDEASQGLGRATGAWANLENVVTYVDSLEHPRDDPALDGLGPLGARAEFEVLVVSSVTPPSVLGDRPKAARSSSSGLTVGCCPAEYG